MSTQNKLLIIGAHSALAKAFVHRMHDQGHLIFGVSRKPVNEDYARCFHLHACVSQQEDDIQRFVESIASHAPFQGVYVFVGLLHSDQFMPEKRISDINNTQLEQSFLVNAFVPMLWAKHTVVLFDKKKPAQFVCLSARVGSIADNRLGGWYSYRGSKAALNMMLQSFAVELKRTHPLLTIVALHPGTNNTPLSKPFQKNVPAHQLFEPEWFAGQMQHVLAHLPERETLHFIDWQGKQIPF